MSCMMIIVESTLLIPALRLWLEEIMQGGSTGMKLEWICFPFVREMMRGGGGRTYRRRERE